MIVFDVDGTLIDTLDQPRENVIALLLAADRCGIPICVWSGGGVEYARTRTRELGLEDVVTYYASKSSLPEVIARGATVFVDDRELGFKIEGVGALQV